MYGSLSETKNEKTESLLNNKNKGNLKTMSSTQDGENVLVQLNQDEATVLLVKGCQQKVHSRFTKGKGSAAKVYFKRGVGIYTSEGSMGFSLDDLVGCSKWSHDGRNVVQFIAYVPKTPSCCGGKDKPRSRTRESLLVEVNSEEVASDIVEKVRGELSEKKERKVLVLINPKSGPGHAPKRWKQCKPILEDANCAITELVTTRQNHALEYVRDTEDLSSKFDDIVIVSGDGLMYEVLQGLMQRKDWAKTMQNIALGIIHGGSGNGLACSINAESGVPHTEYTDAAFVVAKGKRKPMDIAAVDLAGTNEDEPKRVYSFLSLAWAFIADMDIESESMRWAGDARFTLQAVKNLINLRKYKGIFSYVPVGSAASTRTPKSDGVPKTGMSYWEQAAVNAVDFSKLSAPESNLLPPLSQPIPEGDFITVDDTFYCMWNCNCKWMAADAIGGPESTLDDGYVQLCYLRQNGPKGASKMKMLSHLLDFETGGQVKDKSIEMAATQAYRLVPHPDGARRGHIAIDGEVVPYAAMQAQVLPGFANVISL